MIMQKTFSIIIPLYNKEHCIALAIQSVLNQTFIDFELIIVNDGSTDNSLAVASSFKDDRILLLSKANGGVSSARNLGILQAEGKYVCFLDADDLWEEDFLQVVMDLFDKYPECGMACPSYKVNYDKKVVYPVFKSVSQDFDCLVDSFLEMATGSFWVCNSSCVAIKKSVLDSMDRWFPECETVYEDYDMWIRIGTKYKVAHSNKICATYNRISENNARTAHLKKVIYSATFMNTLNELEQIYAKNAQDKEWIQEIHDRRWVTYIFSLINTANIDKAREELKNWNVCKAYKKYKIILKIISFFPSDIVQLICYLRLKLF